MSSTPYADAVLATGGLKMLLPLWDLEGAKALDLAGIVAPEYVGAPVRGQASLLPNGEGKCIKFGAGNYVNVPHLEALNLGDVWTLQGWVKLDPAAAAESQNILSKGNGAYYMRLQKVAGVYRAQSLRSQQIGLTQASTTQAVNTVYHLCATKNGEARKLYVNGADVTTLVGNQVCTNTATPLVAGQTDAGFAGVFEGWMQYLAVYNVALAAATNLAHYEAGSAAVRALPPLRKFPDRGLTMRGRR